MIVNRVEKHKIKKNNKHYKLIDHFCFLSKNLYNHANYLIRSEFLNNNKWVRYNELDTILKNDLKYPDYRNMPTAQSAQQILRRIDKDWKSFFVTIKDWSKHKEKYTGRPKLPKYKKKNGRNELLVTNQNCKLKDDGYIHFPKVFEGFVLKPVCIYKENFLKINQVRFNPKKSYIEVEVVYSMKVKEFNDDNKRYCSVDIGIDNLAAVTNNIRLKPFVINGKGLKSANKYYNKKMSHYKEVAKRMNHLDYTDHMNNITEKRNNKINDYMHKASRYIIDFAIKNNINTIVIGYNKNWKQKSSMNMAVNQSFIGIPTQRFIDMVQYKAEEYGIKVILNEEAYTSGTSFLDGEDPVKENYNKKRRICRGLFKSNDGRIINADVNGSLQILKKVFPDVFNDGIEGVVLHPVRVNAGVV